MNYKVGLIKITKMLQSLIDFAKLRPDDRLGHPSHSLLVLQQQSTSDHNRKMKKYNNNTLNFCSI